MSIEYNKYDQRQCKTVDVVTGYAEWADGYDEMLTGHLERPVLDALKGIEWDVVKEVADLACGTWRTGEWLLERNSALLIDGVDISQEMLPMCPSMPGSDLEMAFEGGCLGSVFDGHEGDDLPGDPPGRVGRLAGIVFRQPGLRYRW